MGSLACPVCKTEDPGVTTPRVGASKQGWSCPRCGSFALDEHLAMDTMLDRTLRDDLDKRAVLSHWIRTQNESKRDETLVLSRQLVDSIVESPRPSLPEQADYYVRWIGDNVKVGGKLISVKPLAIQAIIGSASIEEFELVSGHLKDAARLIIHGSGAGAWRNVTLSFAGWERYREIQRATSDSRRAFMAMEYGHPDLDSLFKDVLKPAVKQTGFDLFILPERPKAGLIDNRLRVEIRTSRFLIADLTHENAGAYWEAGYAEGLEKPVIYTCEKNKFETCKTHFDTNHHLTLRWDSEGSTEIVEELKATIRATLPAEAKLTDD